MNITSEDRQHLKQQRLDLCQATSRKLIEYYELDRPVRFPGVTGNVTQTINPLGGATITRYDKRNRPVRTPVTASASPAPSDHDRGGASRSIGIRTITEKLLLTVFKRINRAGQFRIGKSNLRTINHLPTVARE